MGHRYSLPTYDASTKVYQIAVVTSITCKLRKDLFVEIQVLIDLHHSTGNFRLHNVTYLWAHTAYLPVWSLMWTVYGSLCT